MPLKPHERIIVALDVPNKILALALAKMLKGNVGMAKVGLELFTAEGPEVVRGIMSQGMDVFLDLKFHDIPNTVAGAVRSASGHRVAMMNMHCLGGPEMMLEGVKALYAAFRNEPQNRPLLLGVTILTSHDYPALCRLGLVPDIPAAEDLRSAFREKMCEQEMEKVVVRLAQDARSAGLDGVIASPKEIRAIRSAVDANFKIITPGVRPAGANLNDQKRVMTPEEAIALGADYVVVGRPITGDPNPVEAACKIAAKIAEVSK